MGRYMVTDIIFDFFGTLVSYTHGFAGKTFPASHDYLTSSGFQIEYDDFLKAWSESIKKLEDQANETSLEFHMDAVSQAFFLDTFGEQVEESTGAELVEIYVNEWDKGVTYLEGISDFLRTLSKTHRLSLISNTHYVPLVMNHLDRMGITDLFACITLSVTHGYRKPHPKIFQDTLNTLEVEGADTLYVGDNFLADYCGARDAGMNAVLIDPDNTHHASDRLAHLYELPDQVLRKTP